jgi:biopolymer transport protein ExbD
MVAPTTKLSVSVDQDNKVYLNGVPIGIRELSAKLSQELGDKPTTERMVLLKVHKETLASTFNPIMEAVSAAGGEVVHVIDEEVKK